MPPILTHLAALVAGGLVSFAVCWSEIVRWRRRANFGAKAIMWLIRELSAARPTRDERGRFTKRDAA